MLANILLPDCIINVSSWYGWIMDACGIFIIAYNMFDINWNACIDHMDYLYIHTPIRLIATSMTQI